jgi:hypothetical protein
MNSDEKGPGAPEGPRHLLSRRTTLRGAAAVASLAWVAPAVQVVSMTSAHAASAPPPDVRPPGEAPHVEPPQVGPVEERPPVEEPPGVAPVVERPPVSRHGPQRQPVAGSSGVAAAAPQAELPATGSSPWGALGVGTATVATGAAAIAAAHHLKSRTTSATGGAPAVASPVHEPARDDGSDGGPG